MTLSDRIAWGFCLLLASAPSFLVAALPILAAR